jgi:malonyl-CoA O-methyltransferase
MAGRATLAALRHQLFARGTPTTAALDQSLALVRGIDLRTLAPTIRAPALVVAGDRDTLAPRAAGAWLASALPNARFAEIAGAAHAPFLSHREAFLASWTVSRWPLTRAFPPPTRATSIRVRSSARSRRAAATYDAAAVLQREVATRLAERLDYVKIAPDTILDAGCGTGTRSASSRHATGRRASSASTSRCRWRGRRANARGADARCSTGCSRPVRAQRGATPVPAFVCADVNALPFQGVAFDLTWSNLTLQWVNDLPRVFAEFRRTSGSADFSVLDVRAGYAEGAAHGVRARRRPHAHQPLRRHARSRRHACRGRLRDPVMEMEPLTLTYEDPGTLLAELKALGATNATRGRPAA